jgi:hypothetical protein
MRALAVVNCHLTPTSRSFGSFCQAATSRRSPSADPIRRPRHSSASAARSTSSAYNNLGGALGRQGKHGEAEATYRKAIALWPEYAEGTRLADHVQG